MVAMFIPVIRDLSRTFRLPATRLYIPLSYASILGGTCTLSHGNGRQFRGKRHAFCDHGHDRRLVQFYLPNGLPDKSYGLRSWRIQIHRFRQGRGTADDCCGHRHFHSHSHSLAVLVRIFQCCNFI